MYMQEQRKQPSLINLGLTVLLVVIGVGYAIIAMNTEDPLWFLSSFNAEPAEMYVYCYGEPLVVDAGHNSYQQISTAVNQMLSGSKRWDPLTMSDTTYADYQNSSQMLTIELRYQPAARVHSFYKFYKKIDSIVVPLDGRHAKWNAVFGRLGDQNLSGALMVEDKDPVIRSVAESGLCTIRNLSSQPELNSQQ